MHAISDSVARIVDRFEADEAVGGLHGAEYGKRRITTHESLAHLRKQ